MGHSSKKRRLTDDGTRARFIQGMPSAISMAGCITSANDIVPNSRSATRPASTMPGTRAGIKPGDRDHSLESAGFERQQFAGKHAPGAEILAPRPSSASCRLPRSTITLPSLVRIRIGSFAAETEVRELGYRGCEHRRQTAIDRVSAFMKDAHSGFSRVVATRRYGGSHAADGLANGTFPLYFALSQEEDGGAQEQDYRFAPHFRIIRGNGPTKVRSEEPHSLERLRGCAKKGRRHELRRSAGTAPVRYPTLRVSL